MAEHGFYQFYETFLDFKMNYKTLEIERILGISKAESDLKSIVIEQLRKPIVIMLCLNGIATIIFFAEIFVHQWLKRRNCNVTIQIFKFVTCFDMNYLHFNLLY